MSALQRVVSTNAKRIALAAILAGAVVSAIAAIAPAQTPSTPPPPPAAPAATGGAPAPAPAQDPIKATIVFTTSPSVNATVTWGKTLLGRIVPGRGLAVVRPRDSGPLDVTVRAPGYLPVHTRAQTFTDSRLSVKLTRPEDKATLFGYRAPLPDAGVLDELAPGTGGAPAELQLQTPPQ